MFAPSTVAINMASGRKSWADVMDEEDTPLMFQSVQMNHNIFPMQLPMPQCCAPTKLVAGMTFTNASTNASTALPSGACSPDACSEVGEDEDLDGALNELIQQLEAGGAEQTAALEALEGIIQDLSFDLSSCRVVQKAFECADVDIAASLALELKGRVLEAAMCPHANHVLQKMLDVLPAKHTRFVIEELVGAGVQLARHKFGCRVLTRVVKVHFSGNNSDVCRELADELLEDAGELARHSFAHYVIEAVLEHGTDLHRHEVSVALRMGLLSNAKNRAATYVVEKALKFCDEYDQEMMVAELFSSAEALEALVGNQFGCHVAKALVRMPAGCGHHLAAILPGATTRLQKTKYGRRVLEDIKHTPGN